MVRSPVPPAIDKPRRYRSPRREQQARETRARIITAAAARFLSDGYAPTTLRAVAADAGVALPTLELGFRTKAALLKAVIDAAIAGDDQPVPMLARAWARRADANPGAPAFVAVFARQLADSAHRGAGLTLVALEAARVDADIAATASQLMYQRRVMASWLVDGIRRRSQLRAGLSRAAAIDTIWVLMDPALYCRLTGDCGWTSARYGRWFADATLRLVTAAELSPPARGRAFTDLRKRRQ